MSPPNPADLSTTEDEVRALVPNTTLAFEEESSEDEPSEENPPEEAPPVEEAGEDAENLEEVPESQFTPPTSPTVLPTSPHEDHYDPPPRSPTAYPVPLATILVGESSHGTVRPRPDEPQVSFTGRRRFHSPEQVPHRDTPARYSLSGDPYLPPLQPVHNPQNPDFTLQLHRELQFMRDRHRDLHSRHERLAAMTINDLGRLGYVMERIEEDLMIIRNTTEEMEARIRRLENSSSERRN